MFVVLQLPCDVSSTRLPSGLSTAVLSVTLEGQVTENPKRRLSVYGLAGGLILEPSAFDHQDAIGELFWGGFAGTQWWISPKKNTAGLIMAQRQMGFTHPFVVEFKRLAYEAVKRKS